MDFKGKASETANKLIELFKSGQTPEALSRIFIKGDESRHCSTWSWNNQLITYLLGYQDAMGYRQWEARGYQVKKGEKAFHIFSPMKGVFYEENKESGEKEKHSFIKGFFGVAVFGDSQLETKPEYPADKYIDTLPLIDLARHWQMKVDTFGGERKSYNGFFSPRNNQISLGVKNLATWAHELIHKAEWDIKNCTDESYRANKRQHEIIAELGGCVLLQVLGHEYDSDVGGAWEYIQHWAGNDKNPAELCYRLVNKICDAVDYILRSADALKNNQLEEVTNDISNN